MIFDWLAREGWIFVNWWLLVTLAGVAVFPLSVRLLRGLPDRGYTLIRPLGLLLVGFTFWLLTSFGFLQNTVGGIVLAWVIVFVLAIVIYMRQSDAAFRWREYWRDNRSIIIFAELTFLLLFFGWTLYRAYQNDTGSTEKPMELNFISGILRSETFPPIDPWMAGYSISYYYFGYVMSAMLTMVSGVSAGIGFSMTSALWFALAGSSAFGVVANLVRASQLNAGDVRRWSRSFAPVVAGGLAVVFLLLMSNFQLPLIELPYQSRSVSGEYLDFWATQERTTDTLPAYEQVNPTFSLTSVDNFSRDWWWFRASRVLRDYSLDGTNSPGVQPIDEFPNFSFVLGDNHPHVLALPFVLLAIGLAFNLVRIGRNPNRYETVLYGLMVGGLIFLNTWDGPIYLAILAGADVLRRLLKNGGALSWWDWLSSAGFAVLLVVIAFAAYFPFFVGFRSQAQGIIPNPLYPTYFPQFFIMFGPFILLTGAYLLTEVRRGMQQRAMNWRLGWIVSALLFGLLTLFMMFLVFVAALIDENALIAQRAVNELGGWGEALPLFIARRLAYAPTTLILLLVIVIVIARIFPRRVSRTASGDSAPRVMVQPVTGFTLLIVGAAAGLILLPEFVYLRDNFGTRINTIFKFYYQAWALLSVATAYGFYVIVSDIHVPRPAVVWRAVYTVVLAGVLTLGLIYPVFAIYSRAIQERGRDFLPVEQHPPLTLDGVPRMVTADDYRALMCLDGLVTNAHDTIVTEAIRDSYNPQYGRVGSILGVPILLGWPGHESQWRGSTYGAIAGTRQPDTDRLYTDNRWEQAVEIINRYGIDYIFYGQTERGQYGGDGEVKFIENLQLVCDYGDSHVYAVGADELTVNFPDFIPGE